MHKVIKPHHFTSIETTKVKWLQVNYFKLRVIRLIKLENHTQSLDNCRTI